MTSQKRTKKTRDWANSSFVILVGVIASCCTICSGLFVVILGGRGVIDLFATSTTKYAPIRDAYTATGNQPGDITDVFDRYDVIYIVVLIDINEPTQFKVEVQAVQGGSGLCSPIYGTSKEVIAQSHNKDVTFPMSAPSYGIFGMCQGEYTAQIFVNGTPRKTIRFFIK